MKKIIIALLFLFFPFTASASTLTLSQISALAQMLQTFAGYPAIVEHIKLILISGIEQQEQPVVSAPAEESPPIVEKKNIELVSVASATVGIPKVLTIAEFDVKAQTLMFDSNVFADVEWLQMPSGTWKPIVTISGPSPLNAGNRGMYKITVSGYPEGRNIGFIIRRFGYEANGHTYVYQGDPVISYISTY